MDDVLYPFHQACALYFCIIQNFIGIQIIQLARRVYSSNLVVFYIFEGIEEYHYLVRPRLLYNVVFYIFEGIEEYHYLVRPWLLYNYDSKRKIQYSNASNFPSNT